MKRILVTCIAVSLGAYPGFAASPKVEAAVKIFKAVSTDAGKLKIFCEMTKAMDAMSDKQDAAADGAQFTGFEPRRHGGLTSTVGVHLVTATDAGY
jgi:hypothetical protein